VEAAQHYMRSAILNDPDVIDHLLTLPALRDECGPFGWPYIKALYNPVLLEQFTADYLDDRTSVIRERLDGDGRLWREAIPVGQMGAGYGRERGSYPSMNPDTIELAVADFVYRLCGRKAPQLGKAVTLPSTLRQVRKRARQLPRL
jgi:hypothetical protein